MPTVLAPPRIAVHRSLPPLATGGTYAGDLDEMIRKEIASVFEAEKRLRTRRAHYQFNVALRIRGRGVPSPYNLEGLEDGA